MNPPSAIEAERKRLREEREKQPTFPEEPRKDVLAFLIDHAPLEDWKRDILSVVREEAYYFAPQRQTKIMNEGWASYWHSKIMTEKALDDSELIDFAEHHAGTMGMQRGRLNPYKLGLELFRDIEDRWNKGKFGSDYENCEDMAEQAAWDVGLGQGREKIFEVRRNYNDIGFIDTFLTEEFCREQKLFTYGYNERQSQYEISSREFEQIKRQLLFSLTNSGQPLISATNGNFRNGGQLLLSHEYDGVELRMDYAKDTLRNVETIWGRPVHLETVENGQEILLSCDGAEVTREIAQSKAA